MNDSRFDVFAEESGGEMVVRRSVLFLEISVVL